LSPNNNPVKYRNPVDEDDEKIAPPLPFPLKSFAVQFVKLQLVMLNTTELPKKRAPTKIHK
jgi:hypothetical protein